MMNIPFRLTAVAVLSALVAVACSATTEDSADSEAGDDQEVVTALKTCGGITGRTCSSGTVCVDDPRDACDPSDGDRDCSGVCVSTRAKKCGGFAGLSCGAGYECVDDPRDACNPGAGGRDCEGLCVKVQTSTGPHCPTIRCAPGYHCEEKGINGGTIGGCVRDSSTGTKCAAVLCKPGTHCEEKGINGGKIAVCIQDPEPWSPSCTKMIMCALGFVFDRNSCSCVEICGGFAGIGCPSGKTCRDDPSDSCDPAAGGRDCSGLCL